jgi:hypothetical protein
MTKGGGIARVHLAPDLTQESLGIAEGEEIPRRIAWQVSAGRKKWFERRDY